MTYHITKGIVKVNVCDEHILVSTGEARNTLPYLKHLNEAGAYIWERLEKSMPVEEIAKAIVLDYGIAEQDAEKALQGFLQVLCDAGYLYIDE